MVTVSRPAGDCGHARTKRKRGRNDRVPSLAFRFRARATACHDWRTADNRKRCPTVAVPLQSKWLTFGLAERDRSAGFERPTVRANPGAVRFRAAGYRKR